MRAFHREGPAVKLCPSDTSERCSVALGNLVITWLLPWLQLKRSSPAQPSSAQLAANPVVSQALGHPSCLGARGPWLGQAPGAPSGQLLGFIPMPGGHGTAPAPKPCQGLLLCRAG